MLREVVHTENIERQKMYLTRVYKWFFAKMSSIGAISMEEKQNEDEFMHPEKYEEKEKKRKEELEVRRKMLQSQEYISKTEKGWFEAGERTIHKDLMPAKERIEFYKRKLPRDPNQSMGETSTRPTTKSSTTRVRTAKTRGDTVYGQSFRPSFNTFYTTGEEVKYNNLIKVESKSSYVNYVPSDNIVEQKLEKMWRENKNKEIAEKRCYDEIQQTLKEWGDAKSRYEEDIHRKNESMWFGSNIMKYERKTKKKKIDLHRNHLEDSDGSSLFSDSELDETENEEKDEKQEQTKGDNKDSKEEGTPAEQAYGTKKEMVPNQIRIHKKPRAQTAGRSKRKPYRMPRLIDSSREAESKLCFANIDPVGAQELAELNNPKLKPKQPVAAAKQVPGFISIRPKTTDVGKRRIETIRKFHADLINTKPAQHTSNTDLLDNIFVSRAGQDVISLSIYNNPPRFSKPSLPASTQSASILPSSKLRPQSAPFKFAPSSFAFTKSIRRDQHEELAEIESLKIKLTKEDIPFRVQTIKKAFDMPKENEFQVRK